MIPFQQNPKAILVTGILLATLYSIGLVEIGIEIGQIDVKEQFRRQLRGDRRNMIECGGHPQKLYGHVHVAKTGGSSLNNQMALTFERVCGHKNYSYEAFRKGNGKGVHLKVPNEMDQIGYEDCDYISQEARAEWWIDHKEKFHNMEMELHVPCRDSIDHLLSMCHFDRGVYKPSTLKCDAETEEEYFDSVKECFVAMNRYDDKLEQHFSVKCFDFKESFTGYVEYMKNFLEERRFIPDQFEHIESANSHRNKDTECIWDRPDLLEKTRKWLIQQNPYYEFCDKCMGTNNELSFTSDNAAQSS
eukprot:CAMPEP_0183729840 /NCGR_PEP_ID=MMETSP0737-20130205/31358_1 /TAXON_ID=385413 /ORGANISM="Thalassiosira miniscula, Strain CCMP1093" /LENGTH=302 /DNA_ID=CAMNT_0025962147 /DNA_START=19 /DNA_END=927 /DNA_ORIENTATION=+